jgi:hypothetical protein
VVENTLRKLNENDALVISEKVGKVLNQIPKRHMHECGINPTQTTLGDQDRKIEWWVVGVVKQEFWLMINQLTIQSD